MQHKTKKGYHMRRKSSQSFDTLLSISSGDSIDSFESEAKVEELIHYPEEVVSALEKHGVIKIGDMELPDFVALKAFSKKPFLTCGCEEGKETDWKELWTKHIADLNLKNESQSIPTLNRTASKAHGWIEMIKLEAYVVTVKYAAGPPDQGLLSPIINRWQSKSTPLSVFGIPALQAVLQYKWETWARRYLLIEFFIFLLWLCSFVMFSILLTYATLKNCSENNELDKENILNNQMKINSSEIQNNTKIDEENYPHMLNLFNSLSMLFMLPFLFIELSTILNYKWNWLKQYWNMLDMMTYSLQFIIFVVFLNGSNENETWFSVILAIQSLLLFSKIQYFLRVFERAKGSVFDTIKIVIGNVKWFLLFIILTLLSFGGAFYILYRDMDQEHKETNLFLSFYGSLLSVFAFMLGEFDYEIFYNTTEPEIKYAAICIFLIYEGFLGVMLLNLLIAIMADSYTVVMADERLWNLCSKAQIIDELETSLPQCCTNRHNPRYLHILKIAPKPHVSINTLWTRLSVTQEQAITSYTKLTEDLYSIGKRINTKLDTMVDIFERNGQPSHL